MPIYCAKLHPRCASWCVVLAFTVVAACSSETDAPAAKAQPSGFDGTFAALQEKLFEGQGCTASACHGEAAAGELRLTADVSYEQLVEAASAGSSLKRVERGDRMRSYLYLKLLAASEPKKVDISGGPMPVGGQSIPDGLLEALRLWIYAGAPKTGTVGGTATLLDVQLPAVKPLSIEPLPAPKPEEGFQLKLPPWTIAAASEREVCFASYFDLRDKVPSSMRDESGENAFVRAEELRQDPQSHHLILTKSKVGTDELNHEAFGAWKCRGGDKAGSVCEPMQLDGCGAGICATEPKDSFACIGFGPPVKGGGFGGGRTPIGGTQKAQDYDELPAGVYRKVPLRGILFWNSHAFNLTTEDHLMNGRINLLYASDRKYVRRTLGGVKSIFLPKTPPFERQEVCSTVSLPKGAHLYALTSHTHKRGERFTIFHPDGTLLYENLIYNDPARKKFDPPLVFDSDDKAKRTLRYCALYNNGVGPDGKPDPETVTRYSRLPKSVHTPGVPGLCTPKACVSGRVGEPCNGKDDHGTCDSKPGAGDGMCDACAITGGESTENEMFLILGSYYVK